MSCTSSVRPRHSSEAYIQRKEDYPFGLLIVVVSIGLDVFFPVLLLPDPMQVSSSRTTLSSSTQRDMMSAKWPHE